MIILILSFSVFTYSIVAGSHVIPCVTLEIHPVVSILTTHGQTILIINIIRFSFVPSLVFPRLSTDPLPGAFSKEIHSSQPVAVGVVSIKHLEPVHDEVVLVLAGWLGQEPVVLDTALHCLVPVHGTVVPATAATRVVVAAGRVVSCS